MKTFNSIQSPISHNLKDPHSKSLEPDRLSPPLAITTQPHRRGVTTHLQLSLAYERRGTGFQRRFKEIAFFGGGTGDKTFPIHGFNIAKGNPFF